MNKRKTYKKRKPVSKAVVSYVNRTISRNVEKKFYPIQLTNEFSSISTTWVEEDTCAVAQGVSYGGRIGNKIRITSFELQGVISTQAADNYNTIRIVLALWEQGAGTSPLATLGNAPPTYGVDSPIKTKYGTKGLMLRKFWDKYILLEEGTGKSKCLNYYKKFKKPIEIQYGDNTTTYPSKRLILSVISDSGAVTHPYMSAGYFITNFEDA